MAAGYELTQLRPGVGDIRTVHKAVRPVLEFIFEEGFPHNISKVTISATKQGTTLLILNIRTSEIRTPL